MTINLDTYFQDLQELYVRACEVSLECQQLILEAGADILPNEIVMTPESGFWFNCIPSESDIVWLFAESLDWDLEMSVPIAVLNGGMTIQEWADIRIADWKRTLEETDGSIYD